MRWTQQHKNTYSQKEQRSKANELIELAGEEKESVLECRWPLRRRRTDMGLRTNETHFFFVLHFISFFGTLNL